MERKFVNFILNLSRRFEQIVVVTLLMLMMFVVAVGIYDLTVSVFASVNLVVEAADITFDSMKDAFSEFLMVLIGLELIQTIKMYLREDMLHVEVVILVALISVGRHVIELDFIHLSPLMSASMGILTLSLAAAFLLIRKGLPQHGLASTGNRFEEKVANDSASDRK